jgi:hypothetical protein
LAIHLPGMIYNSPMAVWVRVKDKYEMRGEGQGQCLNKEAIPLRSHQH